MEENTALQPNGANTDPAVDSAESEVIDNQGAPEVVDNGQAEEPAVVEPISPEPTTRSERREQNYIDKLSEAISHSSQLTTRRSDTRTDDYQPLKYEEGEFDADQLEADRTASIESARRKAISEFESQLTPIKLGQWADKLEYDNERVAREWSVLDQNDKDNFDPDFASEMTQKYLNFIGYKQDDSGTTIERPNVRWTDFVRAERQNVERFAQREIARSQKNITQQAAKTGVRPTGQARTSKGHNVDTTDPNWISKLTSEEYDEWGRELSDEIIARNLGISK